MGTFVDELPPEPNRGQSEDDYVPTAQRWAAALPRFGRQMDSLGRMFNMGAGVLQYGYLKAVAYQSGLSMTLALQTVEYAGLAYAPVLSELPFVTSGVFEGDKFRLIQGLTADQLAASSGASLVAYTAPGDGSVPSTVEKKLQQFASIIDTGGAGDYIPATGTGVNCIDALSAIIERGPNRQVIRFPAILGQPNNYLLSFPSGYTVDAEKIVIDADPGVTLYTESVVLACDFVRPTKQIFIDASASASSLPMTYVAQPLGDRDQVESNKTRWLNRGDISAPVRKMIDPRAGWRKLLLTFPGAVDDGGDGSGVADTAMVTFDATSVAVNTQAGDGALHAGFTRLLAGDELGARLEFQPGSSGYIPAVIFRSATGYAGVFFNSLGCTSFVKRVGANVVQRAATSLGMGVHESYSPLTSIITARLLSAYRFQVLVNGAVVFEGESSDPIAEAGFGGYISEPCYFRWTDLFVSRGHAPAAARHVGLFMIGDSITADQQGCWPRRCREALEGTYGVRVVQYHNQAVPGHSSTSQLAILRANGIPAGTTDVLIQIGTNDVQGGISATTLAANVGEMIDKSLAAGARVTVGLPPLWYTQGQAGNRGQASTNYGGGTLHRIALMRLCAERGILLLDSLPAYGPIVANFVNPTLAPNLLGRDPMVFDNIHPGSYMAKIMGYAYAGLLLGQMVHVGTNAVPWTNLPASWEVQNNWALDPTDGAQFKITDDGSRRLRANYSTGVGANLADGTTIQSFGRLLWPSRPVPMDAWTPAGTRLLMILGADGMLKVYGAAGIGATQVYVDSGFYDIT